MIQITLAAARVNKGLTQIEAAKQIGVSVTSIKNWEAGRTYPNQPQIERLCNVYGVTYDNLFFA